MMKTKETPVLLLTGYLGSGKTTLVNHILSNERGIKFAVIVNDIGEVNIDADLIQKGGIVGKKDDSLVALQNGCICCTLKMDLVEQLNDILKMNRFDYIVIEASGICEPEPIAQTICSIPSMGEAYTRYGTAKLDCIVTVVDALRLQSEFACGDDLTRQDIGEEDIENLIIQQIEFCNLVLLNKASEVEPAERERIRHIIHTLQPGAEIIECDYGNVELDKLIHTHLFHFTRTATSAGWIREIEKQVTEEEEKEAHLHGHHHEHEEEEHHHDHEHEHDHEHDHEDHEDCDDPSECTHSHDDEHIWLSLKHAVLLCGAIADTLGTIDPEHQDAYAENAAAYIGKLTDLDGQYQAAVDAASTHTLLFADRFPFRYLADDYGLTYYAAFSGCSAETEASFETVAFLAGKVDELSLPCVLTIEGATHQIAQTVVGNTSTKNQTILVLDSMQSVTAADVERGATYLGIMEQNLETLKTALG